MTIHTNKTPYRRERTVFFWRKGHFLEMVLHYTYHLSPYLSLLIEFYQPDDRLRSRILVVQLVFEFQLTTTGLTGLKDNGVAFPFPILLFVTTKWTNYYY